MQTKSDIFEISVMALAALALLVPELAQAKPRSPRPPVVHAAANAPAAGVPQQGANQRARRAGRAPPVPKPKPYTGTPADGTGI